MNKVIVALFVLILCSLTASAGLVNSSNHLYHLSPGAVAGNVSSASHGFDIVAGLPSWKNITSANENNTVFSHKYYFGMLTPSNITPGSNIDVCSVSSGPGIITRQWGSTTNATITLNNLGLTNLTCNMSAVDDQCLYIATGVSYMTIPYNTSRTYTWCEIVLVTNESIDTRDIQLYVAQSESDLSKILAGTVIAGSLLGIYIGWKKVEEDL